MLDSISGLGPYIFTYGGTEIFMALATIVVLLLYFKVPKSLMAARSTRVIAALSVWALLWVVAYGDVLSIAWHAKQLCRAEAGPHVYRTAETDGFLGSGGIVYWAPYGFSYVEYKVGRYRRETMKDGKPLDEIVTAPISQYEFVLDSHLAATQIMRDRDLIRDRKTGEVLGEYISFAIFPGWIDSKFLSATGFTFTPPRCNRPRAEPGKGGSYDIYGFIKSILKPPSKNSVVQTFRDTQAKGKL